MKTKNYRSAWQFLFRKLPDSMKEEIANHPEGETAALLLQSAQALAPVWAEVKSLFR